MNQMAGDLIALAKSGEYFDVIVHGCNCFHTMGAGIAKGIRSEFPEAYEADCQTAHGDLNKLGDVSFAEVTVAGGKRLTVVNAYTQFDFKGPGPNVDYEAIRNAFYLIRKQFHGLRMGYPMIGAGLAGGDWAIISAIIDEELAGEDHTLVLYQPA